MPEKLKSCPDCSGDLRPVKLVSPTAKGSSIGGWEHELVGYAEEKARLKGLKQTYELSGYARGYICSDCDRIFLYGGTRYENLG